MGINQLAYKEEWVFFGAVKSNRQKPMVILLFGERLPFIL